MGGSPMGGSPIGGSPIGGSPFGDSSGEGSQAVTAERFGHGVLHLQRTTTETEGARAVSGTPNQRSNQLPGNVTPAEETPAGQTRAEDVSMEDSDSSVEPVAFWQGSCNVLVKAPIDWLSDVFNHLRTASLDLQNGWTLESIAPAFGFDRREAGLVSPVLGQGFPKGATPSYLIRHEISGLSYVIPLQGDRCFRGKEGPTCRRAISMLDVGWKVQSEAIHVPEGDESAIQKQYDLGFEQVAKGPWIPLNQANPETALMMRQQVEYEAPLIGEVDFKETMVMRQSGD